MISGNREYKSDVFSMLMEDPQHALDLYNAVNGSAYTDPGLVEMKRLDGGISLTVRNDAAFILDMNLSIYEHQSTVCPNMPLRSLIYFTYTLERMFRKKELYGRSPVAIPKPHFAVFYNGEEEQPERYEQRLSDLFERPADKPEIELVCTVYNINPGKNEKLLRECPFLKEYMTFVTYVRENHRSYGYDQLEHAIEIAIDCCIREDILREFFLTHRSEVVKAMTLDYTFDRRLELAREESRTEGRAEGLAKGRAEGLTEGRAEEKIRNLIYLLCRKVAKQKSLKQTAEEMETTEEAIKPLYDLVCQSAPEYDEAKIYELYKAN